MWVFFFLHRHGAGYYMPKGEKKHLCSWSILPVYSTKWMPPPTSIQARCTLNAARRHGRLVHGWQLLTVGRRRHLGSICYFRTCDVDRFGLKITFMFFTGERGVVDSLAHAWSLGSRVWERGACHCPAGWGRPFPHQCLFCARYKPYWPVTNFYYKIIWLLTIRN